MMDFGNKRQFFWNNALPDPVHTTAVLRLSDRPVRRERVMICDAPWEGDHCSYFRFFYDEDIHKYRMYYCAVIIKSPFADNFKEVKQANLEPDLRFCYAESDDGLHWTKPDLGLHEINGSRHNNVLIPETHGNTFDNFFVFKDPNPACTPDARYKAIGYDTRGEVTERRSGVPSNRVLLYWKSSDGIHFGQPEILDLEGRFDTHNTVYWSAEDGLYHVYFRDIHVDEHYPAPDGSEMYAYVRDIYHAASPDFRHWSKPDLLSYGDDAAFLQMYTNGIIPYYRGEHMWIGFPTRYYEYQKWLPNFDYLPGRAERLEKCERSSRLGLALTDCTFMCSLDRVSWHRFDEAYFTPGPENSDNWFYGCCYPAVGHFETVNDFGERELSMLMRIQKWDRSVTPARQYTTLYRYTMRVDGFACVHADAAEAVVLTKPFTFDGSALEMNFRTSAGGYVLVSLTDEGGNPLPDYTDARLFGDAIDRPVIFDGDLAALRGKKLRMRLCMKDADVYSFRFFDT